MATNKGMSPMSRMNSIGYAWSGLTWLFKKEPNALIHLIAAAVVVVAGIAKGIGPGKWALLAIAIGMVWMAEAINTAMEGLCDYACDKQVHPQIKVIKDLSAAAVLIAALVSIAIGVVVFFF